MTEIIETKRVKLRNPILIEGFPGVGMIGTAATMYLVKLMKMEMCGYIKSEKFPPFCSIHNGIPLPPARIYASKEKNMYVIFSEFAIPLTAAYDVADEIIKWCKKKKVRRIYSLGGISIKVAPEDIDKVFGVATTDETRELLKKNDVMIIKEGLTTGVTGAILANCYVKGYPALSLLTPSRALKVDLMSAAAVLEKLEDIEGIDIDTDKLMEEGRKIERIMKELIDRAKEVKERYKKIEEIGPMYR